MIATAPQFSIFPVKKNSDTRNILDDLQEKTFRYVVSKVLHSYKNYKLVFIDKNLCYPAPFANRKTPLNTSLEKHTGILKRQIESTWT